MTNRVDSSEESNRSDNLDRSDNSNTRDRCDNYFPLTVDQYSQCAPSDDDSRLGIR